MSDFEQDLREALQRREPPDGFTERVMARVPREIPRRTGVGRHWMAIAATLCIGVVGTSSWQIHRRQVEGERAKQELFYALAVASGKLDTARQMITR